MPNCRWFHVTASTAAAVAEVCLTRQQEVWPDNELSVRRNLAGTEAIMKVDNASKSWRSTQPWIFDNTKLLAIFDRDDHHTAHPSVNNSEWFLPPNRPSRVRQPS